MALFSFTDIIFGNDRSREGVGPKALLKSNPFKYEVYRYPEDLGNVDRGHYMVIHINTQRRSTLSRNDSVNELPTVYVNRIQSGYQTPLGAVLDVANESLYDSALKGLLERVGTSLTNITGSSLGQTTGSITQDFSKGFLRTIQRTKATIALYMPDTLLFNFNQSYSDPNLADSTYGTVAMAGAEAVKTFQQTGSISKTLQNLSPFVTKVLKDDAFVKTSAAAYFGLVQNPMIEMLYSSPQFRSFRFDFMFYPRSRKEALEIQKIIQLLTFHQAPEIAKEGQGAFLIPPSEFDLKFYYNGSENMNIPRISTCVLESIDLDFAPNGFASYETLGDLKPGLGGTGMPVAIRMSLGFKETEYLTKSNFLERKNSSDLIGNILE